MSSCFRRVLGTLFPRTLGVLLILPCLAFTKLDDHRAVNAARIGLLWPPFKIDPLRLEAPWTDGYVLERQHTLSSEFLGHDSFGHARFDTKRSELPEEPQRSRESWSTR